MYPRYPRNVLTDDRTRAMHPAVVPAKRTASTVPEEKRWLHYRYSHHRPPICGRSALAIPVARKSLNEAVDAVYPDYGDRAPDLYETKR